MYINYSVLMSVYYREKAQHLDEAINSILKQTVPTNDFVIVCDGTLSKELYLIIDKYRSEHPSIFNIIYLDHNVGLGTALSIGISYCKNEIVARMDSDDISLPNRCEKQLNYFNKNNVDVVGGQIIEFFSESREMVSERIVKLDHNDIVKIAKKKSPMNHVTVMFKKSSVINSGNYKHLKYNEDYYLWIRMILAGYKFGNIDEPLVFVRINDSTFERKQGIGYFKCQKQLFIFMRDNHFIGFARYSMNIIVRFVSAVIPNKIRKVLFLKIMRKKKKGNIDLCSY